MVVRLYGAIIAVLIILSAVLWGAAAVVTVSVLYGSGIYAGWYLEKRSRAERNRVVR